MMLSIATAVLYSVYFTFEKHFLVVPTTEIKRVTFVIVVPLTELKMSLVSVTERFTSQHFSWLIYIII